MHLGAGLWMDALPSSVIVPVTDRVWLSEWQVLLCIYVFVLFIYFVAFNGAVSRSNYVASNGRVRSA